MKNVFFALAFMLVGTFAFANNAKEITTVNYKEAVELVKSLKSTDFSNNLKIENSLELFGTCYITLSFYGEDGEHLATHTLAFEGVANEQECSGLADRIAALL